MSTTINGLSLAALNVADVTVITINQDVDFCNIEMNVDTFAEIPSALLPGTTFDVEVDSRRIFRGVVLNPEVNQSSITENIVLRAESVDGRALRETMRTSSISVQSGNSTTTMAVEFIRLQGTLASIVSGAASQVMPVGLIDLPNISFPAEEQYNLSCLDVIRRALSYAPGAVMWINYSADPPTFNAAKYDSSVFTSVTLQGWSALRLRKLSDSKTRRVRLQYLRQASLTTAYQDLASWGSRTTTDTIETIGTDSSPINPAFSEEFRRTFILPGRADIFDEKIWWYGRSFAALFPDGVTWKEMATHNDSTWWDIRHFCANTIQRLVEKTGWIRASTDWDQMRWLSAPYGSGVNWGTMFWNSYYTGTSTNKTFYDGCMPSPELRYHPTDYPQGVIMFSVPVMIERWFGADHPNNYSAVGTAVFIVPHSGWSRGQRLIRTIVSSGASMPSGVASSLQADFNRPLADGFLVVDRADHVQSLLSPTCDTIQIDGETVRGIRRRTYTASAETLRVEFGPPIHLSPDQIVRSKMFR